MNLDAIKARVLDDVIADLDEEPDSSIGNTCGEISQKLKSAIVAGVERERSGSLVHIEHFDGGD